MMRLRDEAEPKVGIEGGTTVGGAKYRGRENPGGRSVGLVSE